MRRLAALAVLLAAAAAHAETPIPPPPDRFVTDRAGFLSPAAAADLDARLSRYQQETGHQVIVYIDRTTGGVPIEDWAVRAFEKWRVGRRGIDDGAALFVFADDRRLRIEVGYGLEDRVPDARAARIIDQQIVPRVRAGDRDGALRAGVGALLAAIGGEAERPQQPSELLKRTPLWTLIGGGVLLALFLVLLVTHPSLAWLLLLNIGSGRRGGGGWGGGGGFSGGGGRSGGGGASGSW